MSVRPGTQLRASRASAVVGGSLRVLSVHGLLIIILVVVAVFSLLKPSTFPTLLNFQAIGNVRATYGVLALAVMVPLATNEFDLSVGFMAELGSILAVGFQVKSGMHWVVACLLVIAIGVGVGLVNGLLVTKALVPSFIATLGTGTFLLGVSGWYTGGMQIYFGGSRGPGETGSTAGPHGFFLLSENVKGIPVAVLLLLGIGVVLWIGFEYLAVGRYLYVIGSNPRAAELTGIPSVRYKIISFVVSGGIAGIAGCLLGSQLRVGQLGINSALLLPAFAGALLGATSVRPGRVNVWGTLLATALLGITVSGLQQVGAEFYVEQLFNGAMLVVAVALAGFAGRRREHAAAAREARHAEVDQPSGTPGGGASAPTPPRVAEE